MLPGRRKCRNKWSEASPQNKLGMSLDRVGHSLALCLLKSTKNSRSVSTDDLITLKGDDYQNLPQVEKSSLLSKRSGGIYIKVFKCHSVLPFLPFLKSPRVRNNKTEDLTCSEGCVKEEEKSDRGKKEVYTPNIETK